MIGALAGWALLSVALGIGYLVCLKANKEESKLFRYTGYVIGIIILITSLALAISDFTSRRARQVPRRDTTTPRTQRREAPKLPPELEEMLRKQQQEQAK